MILHHWSFLLNVCLVNNALASSPRGPADMNIISQGLYFGIPDLKYIFWVRKGEEGDRFGT